MLPNKMGAQWRLKVLITLIFFTTISKGQKYITCTAPQNINACEQLNRTEDIKCLLGKNLINCLLMVENGEVSFTSVSAEEAFLASSLTKNLVVVAEFTPTNVNSKSDFETAVLIRNNMESDINSLKGAKFCHPGINADNTSPFIMKEFEMQTLSQNNLEICSGEKSKTLSEYYVSALNDFFGPSCRPGKWSNVNSTLDLELKNKYPKLLELCQEAKQKNPFLQSLNCLFSNNGDIALTSLNAIKEYNLTAPAAFTNYSYLCKNGSRINATAGSCTWTRQPWSLLIGNKDSSADLPTNLRNWFILQPLSDDLQLSEKYVQSLKELIFPDHLGNSININFDTPNLETYISEFRDRPTTENSRLCKFSVGLCVASEEEERKCKWLQQAALNYGIQPVVDCVGKSSRLECLKAIQNTMADITVVNSNMTYIVDRHNLSIVAFGEEETRYMVRTALIVNTTTIKRLEDLQGKSGFFSEYGDIAWLAFADLLRQKVMSSPEYYGLELSNFLGNSCMPGVQDTNREPYPIGVSFEKLCALCGNDPKTPSGIENCNTDSYNICYDSEGALKCLGLAGDFAVIVLKEKLTLPSNMSVMCRNGTIASNSLNIDNDCALSVTINDQIVARKNDWKNRDIEMMLQELDERFAAQTHTAFKIFDNFGRIKDLIFKDSTLGMEIATISNNKYVKAQLELFKNIPRPRTTGDIQGGGGGEGDTQGGGGDTGSLPITSSTLISISFLFLFWFTLN